VPLPFVTGVDFGGTKVAVAAATLRGEILAEARLDTEAAHGAEQAVQRAAGAAQAIIARVRRETDGACIAAGIVCPGVVRPDRIALAPNVPGWEDLALEPLMRDELGLERIAVGNDVKAAGLAEVRWGALRDADPALYVNLGTGVAASVLVGGCVLAGAHGAAGEIGYSVCSTEGLGFAEGHAPLEELAGGRFIGIRASRVLGRHATAAEAFAAADGEVRDLVERTLDRLGIHVANMAILLDPERIAVGGGLMGSADRVLAALDAALSRIVPFPPSLVRARFGRDSALRGAIAMALDATHAPTPVAVGTVHR
jgi:glucokinase